MIVVGEYSGNLYWVDSHKYIVLKVGKNSSGDVRAGDIQYGYKYAREATEEEKQMAIKLKLELL